MKNNLIALLGQTYSGVNALSDSPAHEDGSQNFGMWLSAKQPGTFEAKSTHTSKSGPPELHKALLLVKNCLLKAMPPDGPVYQFMNKKRAAGKPYLVYMTAGANKFLHIYYGQVKE